MQRVYLQVEFGGKGRRAVVCSDSCHCYPSRCASPVVVTSTHLSSGNEQMITQSCDVSPHLHFEISQSLT